MLARCARCQGTFSTDRFGVQTCPHCGSEILLADPNAPPGAPPRQEPPPTPPAGAPPPPGPGPSQPVWGAAPPPPDEMFPPPAGPPPEGIGPPPGGGFGPPRGGPGGFGGGPGGPGAPPPGAGLPAPFAERKSRGFFSAFFESWKLAAVEPARFFRMVRIDQTAAAIWFAVIAGTVGTWVQLLFSAVSMQGGFKAMEEMAKQIPGADPEALRFVEHLFAGPAIVAAFVAAPLLAVVRLFLTAALLHVFLLLVRGATRGFDSTLTVVGYASGLYLLEGVPGCGQFIAPIWFAVVAIIGLAESQRCGTGKAAAAVLAPLVLSCLCCLGVLGPAFMKIFHKAIEQGGTTTTTNL